MEFAYEAFTEACSFGLDEAGICVSVKAKPGASRAMLTIAGRCLGAQYVASLDASVDGLLTPHPTPGTRLLFARTEENGRIVLVRSGPLERFMSREDDAPQRTEQTPPSALMTVRHPQVEHVDNVGIMHAGEDETAPFSRTRLFLPDPDELAAVTRRSPATIRAFPPPPARFSRRAPRP